MGNQVQAIGAAGLAAAKFLIWNSNADVFQTTTNTFVTYVTLNRANYEIPLTEEGDASGHYSGTFDPDILAGDFGVVVWDAAGEGANLLAAGQVSWDGTDLRDGVSLAADGLDSIPITSPTGVATTLREMIVQSWRKAFKKSTLTLTELKTFDDAETGVITTQPTTDAGGVQTLGGAV